MTVNAGQNTPEGPTTRAFRSSSFPFFAASAAGIVLAGAGAWAGFSVIGDLIHDEPSASASADPSAVAPSHPAPPSGAPGDEGTSAPAEGDDTPGATAPSDGGAPAEGAPGSENPAPPAPPAQTEPPADTRPRDADGVAYEVHHIVWGDTLWDISQSTGISVDRLASYNSIRNPDLIYAGNDLRIPEN